MSDKRILSIYTNVSLNEEETEMLTEETLRRWEQEAVLNDVISNAKVMDWLDSWGETKSDMFP